MPTPVEWEYPGDSEGEGSGPYAQRGAHWGDHMTHEADTTGAAAMQLLLPDAARNLLHFLGNSGRPLDMNTNGMLNDLPTPQGKVSEDLRTYTNEALKDTKASDYTGSVTYPFVTNWQPEKSGEEREFELVLCGWRVSSCHSGYHHCASGWQLHLQVSGAYC